MIAIQTNNIKEFEKHPNVEPCIILLLRLRLMAYFHIINYHLQLLRSIAALSDLSHGFPGY